MRPYFELDGKRYEFICTRHLQCYWNDLMEETKSDKSYQARKVAYEDRKNRMQALTQKYLQARDDYYSDPLDENKEKLYQKLEPMYEAELKSYTDYVIADDVGEEDSKRITDACEKLVIEALREQYTDGSYDKAVKIWEAYVETVNPVNATELIVYMANEWFAQGTDTETDNGFLKKARGQGRRQK